MENLKNILAKNLIRLRKASNLTQAELAEKINYTDKAISKWERGESVPDIEILYEIAQLYGVTIDDLLSNVEVAPKPSKSIKASQRMTITILSTLLVWFIATVVYVVLIWTTESERVWLVFIYAIPISCTVALVFNSIWGKGVVNCGIISVLIWTIVLSIFLTIPKFENSYLIFVIAAPLQLIVLFSFVLLLLKKREVSLNQLFEKGFKKKKKEKVKHKEVINNNNTNNNTNNINNN